MDHFAGLDVSVKETSICIVDDTGRIVREVKVASEPEALLQVLGNPIYRFKRIGLEAGPLSQWLFSALAEAGSPVICVETRHMRAVLKAQINKTDRNDARGMAQMMRAGLYRPVHVKTLRSQKLRMLLNRLLIARGASEISALSVGVSGQRSATSRYHYRTSLLFFSQDSLTTHSTSSKPTPLCGTLHLLCRPRLSWHDCFAAFLLAGGVSVMLVMVGANLGAEQIARGSGPHGSRRPSCGSEDA